MEYKDYLIQSDGTMGMCEIKPKGRGSVHLSLRGKFTNKREAIAAIDGFLSSKVVTDGKAD